MGRRQRIGFAALAAIIALVAVVVIGGQEDERTERADATPAAATQTPAPQPRDATTTPTPTPTPRPKPRAKVVTYRGGEPVGGLERLEFEKGETARFSIASDVAEEIHVHGYDLYRDVPAGGRVRFAFPADIEGIFEVEMHGSAVQVAELRVEP